MSWDYDADECEQLGHEFEEEAQYDPQSDCMDYVHSCTWCGTVKED